jgi:DNA primase small subunit
MTLFGTASRAEQRRYYVSEWNAADLPRFITEGMESREFAFDHDGRGPSDRYNAFPHTGELGRYLNQAGPFSVYCSVAFYEAPRGRDGIFRTELAFDIDAKDLPVRRCECPPGEVCTDCLDDAKQLALDYMDCLRVDLALKQMHLIYSGRGYHIRTLDSAINMITSSDRRKILDYVSGGVVPKNLFIEHGYSSIFRKRATWILERVRKENLAPLPGGVSNRAIRQREEIIKALAEKDRVSLNGLMGEKRLGALLGFIATIATSLTDAKVTMDEKRIIRLPTSLHSKVSMKCMVVEDPENFDPLRDAVPDFARRRKEAPV